MENKNRWTERIFFCVSACLLLFFLFAEMYPKIVVDLRPYPLWFRSCLLVSVCMTAYLGGLFRTRRTGDEKLLPYLHGIFFVLYMYLILSLTLFDETLRLDSDKLQSAEKAGMTVREYYLTHFVNYKPFASILLYIRGFLHGPINFGYFLLNLLGNLCAFMPMSFFLPHLWKREQKWYVFLLTMLLVVLTVEGLQLLFMIGSCDIDDVILNVGGAVAFWWILKIPPVSRFSTRFWSGRFTE